MPQNANAYWYIGTPYSKYPHGLKAAHKMACEQAARLTKAGINVFSPIAHGEGLIEHSDINPTDHDLWMRIDKPFMHCAKGLIVIRASGWEESRGLTEEIATFEESNKPIFHLYPDISDEAFAATIAYFKNHY